MDFNKFDILSILPRDPGLFQWIEGEEINAPRKIHWEALDNQVFIVFKVLGDLAGHIIVLCNGEEEIYDQLERIIAATDSIAKKFITNFSEQLDLNIIIDRPKVCPATAHFSVDGSFSYELLDYQAKKRLIKVLQSEGDRSKNVFFERSFKFQMQGIEMLFYFSFLASDISRIDQ